MIQELVEEIRNTAREVVNGVHTAFPAKIVSVDTNKGLAAVAPMMKYKMPNGKSMNYPNIYGVPIVFPQSMGQNATIAYPVKEGDCCLVVVAEQTLDFWLYGQETDTNLKHDLSNAVCIPGMFATRNPIFKKACDSNAIILDVNGTSVTVSDKEVKISSDKLTIESGDVTISGNLTVNGRIHSRYD